MADILALPDLGAAEAACPAVQSLDMGPINPGGFRSGVGAGLSSIPTVSDRSAATSILVRPPTPGTGRMKPERLESPARSWPARSRARSPATPEVRGYVP